MLFLVTCLHYSRLPDAEMLDEALQEDLTHEETT